MILLYYNFYKAVIYFLLMNKKSGIFVKTINHKRYVVAYSNGKLMDKIRKNPKVSVGVYASIFERNNTFKRDEKVEYNNTTNFLEKSVFRVKSDNNLDFSDKEKYPRKPSKDSQFIIRAFDEKGREMATITSHRLNNYKNPLTRTEARDFARSKLRQKILGDGQYEPTNYQESDIKRIEYGWTRFIPKKIKKY
jgi:hypothetical protein